MVTLYLRRFVDVRDEEVRALLLAFLYFFFLLSAYYALRPMRDTLGTVVARDLRPLLFTGTFVVMLAAVPLFGWLSARVARRRIIPPVYRFFMASILIFYGLLLVAAADPIVAGAFFIWVSVFNLFVVSVFWSFIADIFRSGQGKRLFGFIAAGGSAGAIAGPLVAAQLAAWLGAVHILLVSVVLLEAAVRCVGALLRAPSVRPEAGGDAFGAKPVGGSWLAGAAAIFRSRYLSGIAVFFLLFTTTSTFLYLEQLQLIKEAFGTTAQRAQAFAYIDLATNILTVLLQLAIVGRLMTWLGVAPLLAVLPVLTALGFAALAVTPILVVLVVFQAVRRAANYALTRPAREVLFTVLPPEDKYKAKNFIDTAVYRGGDAGSAWAHQGLRALGLDLAGVALVAVPLAVAWGVTGVMLGRRQERLAAAAQPAE